MSRSSAAIAQMPVTVIHAARERDMRTPSILSAMAVVSQELALRYLLELSTDIRVALLMASDGELLAAAPERPSERAIEVSKTLVSEASTASGSNEATSVEIDVRLERGAVFLVGEDDRVLVC